jgi:hypothetical protein
MKIVVTVYPDNEDIEQPISWARALGFEVDDYCSPEQGRCVTIRGDISTAELRGVLSMVSRDDDAAQGEP